MNEAIEKRIEKTNEAIEKTSTKTNEAIERTSNQIRELKGYNQNRARILKTTCTEALRQKPSEVSVKGRMMKMTFCRQNM